MIVFTAKNKVTGEVFVGSARESVEENWAQLIVKADEEGSGEILQSIRSHGADSFLVETWGYAEDSSESRELMKDACEELNAQIIRTGRAQIAKTETAPKKAEAVQLRQEGSTKDYQDIKDLMVKIEMKRKENRKTASQTKTSSTVAKKTASKTSSIKAATAASKPQTKHSKVVELKASQDKNKLPEGRVSSSAKEKRIREAIAKEKLERDAKKAAQIAAEADEMAAIMAKLDAKTKEKSKYLRRK